MEEQETFPTEADRLNQLMRGREERIVELKQEINRLCGELGRAAAYATSEMGDKEEDRTQAGIAESPISLNKILGSGLWQQVLDSFCTAVGISAAILEPNGKILIASRWRKICTDFHRVHPKSAMNCLESDTALINRLAKEAPYSLYKCRNGLNDAASAVMVDNRHIASVFIGQFLTAPPDRAYFVAQAQAFGYDEETYLRALDELPILDEDKIQTSLRFLCALTKLIATQVADAYRLQESANYQRLNSQLLSLAEDAQQAKAEAEAANAEMRKLTRAVEQSPATIVITDKDGRIEYVNPRFVQLTGYTPEEVIGQNPRILKSGKQSEQFYKELWDTVLAGKQWYGDLCNKRKSGELYWEHASISPVKNAAGEMAHFIAVKEDVTERRQSAEKIRELSYMLQLVLDNMPAYVFWKNRDCKYLGCNRAFAKDAGLDSPEKIFGLTDFDLAWRKTEAERYRNADQAVMESGVPKLNYEESQHTAEGRDIWLRTSKIPLRDSTGQVVGVLGTYEDITEHKRMEGVIRESEARFRTMFDDSPDAYLIMEVHERGRISACNKATEEMMRGPREQIIGLTPDQISPERQPNGQLSSEAAAIMIRECVDRGRNNFEWVHRRLDGEDFWAHVTVSVITIEGRQVLLVCWRDITDRKRLEEEVTLRQQELVRSNEELEQFAYVASHDLRAPLRAIESLAEWITADLGPSLPAQSAEYLGLMRNRLTRMEALLDSLLQYARVGRTEQKMEELDLEAVAKEIFDLQGLREHFRLETDSLPTITTHGTPLKQVLRNLIGNAAKHHDKGQGIIRVQARLRGGFYEFSVSDDGPGIPEQYHSRVFLMFHTLRPRDEVEGCGMGLTMAKKIVENYGGAIGLEAAKPRGTRVVFTWPVKIVVKPGS